MNDYVKMTTPTWYNIIVSEWRCVYGVLFLVLFLLFTRLYHVTLSVTIMCLITSTGTKRPSDNIDQDFSSKRPAILDQGILRS